MYGFDLIMVKYSVFLFVCKGTTSSSNTVVAGQENFQETDEAKIVRENEERYIFLHVTLISLKNGERG